jgi:hypothetical protein
MHRLTTQIINPTSQLPADYYHINITVGGNKLFSKLLMQNTSGFDWFSDNYGKTVAIALWGHPSESPEVILILFEVLWSKSREYWKVVSSLLLAEEFCTGHEAFSVFSSSLADQRTVNVQVPFRGQPTLEMESSRRLGDAGF